MIWLLALAPVVDGTTNHTSPQAPRQRSLFAQSINDAIHQRCLAASDYNGCIRANGGETSAREKEFNQLSRCNESMEDGLNDDGFVDTSDEEEVGGEYFDNIWSQRQLEEHI